MPMSAREMRDHMETTDPDELINEALEMGT